MPMSDAALGDLGMAVGGEADAHGDRHLEGIPDAARHAPADQLAAVAHRRAARGCAWPSRRPRPPGGSIRASALLL